MPIDFHHQSNANTYASRGADDSWLGQMRSILDGRTPGSVADIGCGGGIYSRGWKQLGADAVTGIDFSRQMIDDARAATDADTVRFAIGIAAETGLESDAFDIVFSRAVIHHLTDPAKAMAEALRITRPGGMVIVQDRTIEDVLQPASPNHFRAQFFAEYPRLLEEERRRRPETEAFARILSESGFEQIECESFWETRKTYPDADSLQADLLSRTGRSILHELTDDELAKLTKVIVEACTGNFPLEERDRWTMWRAYKPQG